MRPATPDDSPSIMRLLSELREQSVSDETLQDGLKTLLSDSSREVLLLEDDDGTQAMAVINLVYKLPKVEARVDEVIVSASSRGKGYGRSIMKACEAWAWDHGSDVIEFTSRPSREAANALYQKLGYKLRETNVYQKKREDA